jgi:hypothetical protein
MARRVFLCCPERKLEMPGFEAVRAIRDFLKREGCVVDFWPSPFQGYEVEKTMIEQSDVFIWVLEVVSWGSSRAIVNAIHACELQRRMEPPRPRTFKVWLGPEAAIRHDVALKDKDPDHWRITDEELKESVARDYQKSSWSADAFSNWPLELLDLNRLSLLLEDLPPRGTAPPG